jgi:hypothetical protein
MDSSLVDHTAHDSTKRVHFAHHVSFRDSSDGRIAGHLADCVQIHGQKKSA